MVEAMLLLEAATVDGSNHTDLARFLDGQRQKKGYRILEEETGVPRSTLAKIVQGQLKGLPELETLIKISTTFELPLWRVIEMAGADVGMAQTPSAQSKRLATLTQSYPEFMSPIIDNLLQLEPNDLRGVLAYLDAVLRQRGEP